VRAADQFLFGYEDGHRLLTGSRELPSATVVRMLGATDAAMAPDSAPLVTGLALRETQEFAFCVTWCAPEAPRPGAVWAHALIVSEAQLRDPGAVDVLLGLPRRPSAEASDLVGYTTPLPLDRAPPGGPSYLPQEPLDLGLLEDLVSTAYSPTGDGILVHTDLGAAAKALLALWGAQWPQLRAGFSFRTREVVRRGASDFDLTVTGKIRGLEDQAPASPAARAPAWGKVVADDAASPTDTPLRRFLWTFGPQEPRDPRRLRRLAGLWLHVAAEDAPRARAHLERYWPKPRSGAALKRALFGRDNNDWWALDEPTRVISLLQAAKPAWDLDELELAERARVLVEARQLPGLLGSLPGD
jgi:GTPase-associated protein 1, N-terminal domain type 1